MFLFDNRKEKVSVFKYRDEWGQMQEVKLQQPRLSNQELADALGVSLTTVLTHRRDQ